jgi:hypothetical protein
MKKILLRIILIFLGFSAGLLLLEIGLRIIGFRKNFPEIPQYYLKADPEIGYDISENFPPTKSKFLDGEAEIWSNNIGCFDKPYNNEGDFILLVGDSFIHGSYLPFELNLGSQIENYLGKRVLKCGVGGYGTKEEFLKAKKIIQKIQKRPSLIIVGYYPNDVIDDYLFPKEIVIEGNPVSIRKLEDFRTGKIREESYENLKEGVAYWKKYCVRFKPNNLLIRRIMCILERNSVLYRISKDKVKNILINLIGEENLRKIIGKPYLTFTENAEVALRYLSFSSPEKYPWLESAWENHFNNILEFKKLAEENNAKLLFFLIPAKEQIYSSTRKGLPQGLNYLQPNQKLKKFFEENEITYLDLLPYFQKYANEKKLLTKEGDLYWRFDCHWNVRGYKLASLIVSKFILENNLLQISNEEKIKKLEEINNMLDSFE